MSSLRHSCLLTDARGSMENKQEWKVNVFFLVLFFILKASGCTEASMERGVILKRYWFRTSISFNLGTESSCGCGLRLQALAASQA